MYIPVVDARQVAAMNRDRVLLHVDSRTIVIATYPEFNRCWPSITSTPGDPLAAGGERGWCFFLCHLCHLCQYPAVISLPFPHLTTLS